MKTSFRLPACVSAIMLFICNCLTGYAQQNALDFDNVNDYVSVSGASALIAGSTSISMTLWVYPDNDTIVFPDYDGFCGFRNNTNADFYLIRHGNHAVEARFRESGGMASDVVMTGLQLYQWHHFAMVYDGNFLRLYHNGIDAGNVLASGTISSTAETFYIGDLLYQTFHFYHKGKMDEVSLWNVALTPDEVWEIYSCAIDPASAGLLLYYKFDQGVANGNNTGITTLLPTTGSLNGTLHNFALTGTSSNFVDGVSTPVHYIEDTICSGQSYVFGSQTLTQSGVCTQTFPMPGGCDSVVELTLHVIPVNTSVSLLGITLISQQTGAQYQWVDCGNGFAIVPGAVNQTYTATANGNYAVIVTINGCSDTSSCVAVTTVGVNGQNERKPLIIQPNPASGEVVLQCHQWVEQADLRLYGIDGVERIRRDHLSGDRIRLDISMLEPGCYFISLSTGGITEKAKLMVR